MFLIILSFKKNSLDTWSRARALLAFCLAFFLFTAVHPTALAEEVEAIIGRMSMEQKVGQLLILGFSGKTVSPSLKKQIARFSPGAVIAFKKNLGNPAAIARLNQDLQRESMNASQLPLFIMIDQEGGDVSRIAERPNSPSPMALGYVGNRQWTENAGLITGQLLKTLGFNMNLAPVVDLADPNDLSFIGNRSFGSDPTLVTDFAASFATGLVKAGIIPTLKHFPGHGGTLQDSHKLLPKKMETLDQMTQNDLVPFAQLMQQSSIPPAVMVGHLAYPKIDPSGQPATFSRTLVHNILRDKMAFGGLIITDDIEMLGAESITDVGERAVAAIDAGADMVMVAWTAKRQRLVQKALINAFKTGRLSEERLNQSLTRILSVKISQKLAVSSPSMPANKVTSQFEKYMGDLRRLTDQVTTETIIKAIQSQPRLRGVLREDQPLTIFSADQLFVDRIKLAVPNPVHHFRLRRGVTPSPAELLKAFGDNPEAVGIFYVTGTGTARILKRLPPEIAERIFVVNASAPASVESPERYRGIFDVFTAHPETGRWISEFLVVRQLRDVSGQGI